jgi:hypothetical protein
MSKEIEIEEGAGEDNETEVITVAAADEANAAGTAAATATVPTGVRELFSFWAKLMIQGVASSDACRYPSQSSVLARQNDGWQSLSGTIPPTVELLG